MNRNNQSQEGCGCFTLIGMILAAILSYKMWASIGWALLAGLFGWIYIIYYIVIYLL